jgi:hypothetical protein
MNMNTLEKQSFFSKYIVEIAFGLVYLFFASILNLQFVDGSNINTYIAGHDEYIAVKEVYSLLHPISWKHFFLAFIAGDVIYYGRLMFYIDALFAFIPFKIWGVSGMVYAIRMAHSLYLVASLLILANVFLKERLQKLLFLIGSGAIYYSIYFLMMPKPEPMQLLCLALFLLYFKRKNWYFGPHFILLGMAFGLKFNIILILPLVFLVPFVKKGIHTLNENVLSAFKSLGFFILGLSIAIPCLILSPLKPIYLRTYIHETFQGTGKSYDDSTLTVFDWLKDGFGGYYLGHWLMGYLFLMLILLVTGLQLRRIKYNNEPSALFLLVSGLILSLVIMFTTKRLWPHYIWTGFIFMFLGLIVFASQQTSLKYRRIYFTFIILFSIISLTFFVIRDLPMYAGFEKEPEMQKDKKAGVEAIQYIKYKYPHAMVAADESLLFSFSDFVKVNPYHPFSDKLPQSNETVIMWYGDHPEDIWNEKNDVVVFYKNNPSKKLRRPTSVEEAKKLHELYQEQMQGNFIRDTVMGEVEILKRNPR